MAELIRTGIGADYGQAQYIAKTTNYSIPAFQWNFPSIPSYSNYHSHILILLFFSLW